MQCRAPHPLDAASGTSEVTLARRTPLKRTGSLPRTSAKRRAHRASDVGRAGLAHMARVRALPCCICVSFGFRQTTPTEAHHAICDRHGFEKVPDHETVSLCRTHHRTGENGFIAIHRGKETWVQHYGSDRDWIAWTLDRIEGDE